MQETLTQQAGKTAAEPGTSSREWALWRVTILGRRLRVDLLLVLVLLLAAGVRLFALNWGWTDFSPLPAQERPAQTFNNFHPDEASNLRVARNMYTSGNWRPTGELYGQTFDYSLYGAAPIYLHIAATWVSSLFGDFTPFDLDDEYSEMRSYVAVRWLTALLGLACVPLVYWAALLLYGRRAALLAALLLAFSAFHAQSGRFGTVDIPMVFFSCWSFAHSARYLRYGKWRDILLAALAAGLALASKINSLLIVVPIIAAELMRGAEVLHVQQGDTKRWWLTAGWLRYLFSLRLVSAGVLTIAVFLILNPYVFLDFHNYLYGNQAFGLMDNVRNVRGEFFKTFQIQFEQINPWSFLVTKVLPWACGLPQMLLAGLGLLFMLWRRKRADLLLLAWLLPMLAMTGNAQVMYMRYALPLLPPIALASSILLDGLMDGRWLEPGSGRTLVRVSRSVGVVLTLVAVILSGAWTCALASVHRVEDSRISAGRYLAEVLPDGVGLLHERSANSIKPVIHMPRYNNVCLEGPTVIHATGNLAADQLDYLAGRLDQVQWAAILESNRKLGFERSGRYPGPELFYRDLFAGKLGFVVDTVFQTLPRIAGMAIDDRPAEFSLRYYDHDAIYVFRRTEPTRLWEQVKLLKEELRGLERAPDFYAARAQSALAAGNLQQARDLAAQGLQWGQQTMVPGERAPRGAAEFYGLLGQVFALSAGRQLEAGQGAQVQQSLQQAQQFLQQALQLDALKPGSRAADLGFMFLQFGQREAALALLQQARGAALSDPALDELQVQLSLEMQP